MKFRILVALVAAATGFRHLVDDALDEDYADVDVAGYVGKKFGNEVVGRSRSEASGVAGGGGGKVGLLARDIEIGNLVVDGEADKVRVVDHVASVITLGPADLEDGVNEPARNGGVGHAVIVGILVNDGWDKKGPKEFASGVFGVSDADVAEKTGKAGSIRGVGIGADVDGGVAGNGDEVERVTEVADGEPALFFWSEGFDLGTVKETGIPVDDGHIGWAGGRLDGRKRGLGNAGGIQCADGGGGGNCGTCVAKLAWSQRRCRGGLGLRPGLRRVGKT